VDDMPTNNPTTEPKSATATISTRLIFESDSRILGRLPCSAMIAEIGQPDEDADGRGDAKAAPSKSPTGVGPDVSHDPRSRRLVDS
jgi:hypothetical protein